MNSLILPKIKLLQDIMAVLIICESDEDLIKKRSYSCPDNISLTLLDPQPASVAQLDAPSDWRPGCGFNPRRGRQHSFVEIDHEIFSTVILSLPLIQEGQLVSFWRKNVHNTG